MSRISVPWRETGKREYRGLAGVVAEMASGTAAIARPLLKRFPAPIFFGSLVGGVVVIFLITLASEAFLSEYPFVKDLLVVTGLTVFIAHIPLFAIWWERKVAGRIQSRTGPMRVGGWHGWAQSFADGIKLVCKEDLVPAHADSLLFRAAPYITLIPVVVAFAALPFAAYWGFRNLDVGLVFILAMLGVEVVGVIMAGWSSNSKWTTYGAMREACQMVSYEIPLAVALLLPVLTVGSLNLSTIGQVQAGGWHAWLVFQSPFMFAAALTYYVASLASCKRAPFDLPESESELVAGFLTEYSGIRWALFFFAEYAAMFLVSALAVLLFFGAWYTPLPAEWGNRLLEFGPFGRALYSLCFAGPVVFITKSFILIYVQIWIRWTLPRVRIDQVLYACVQVILPLTLVMLLGQTFWQLWVREGGALASVTRIVLSIFGALVLLSLLGVVLHGFRNRRQLVGVLARDLLAGG